MQAVARQVRRRRLEIGLSVQKVADICTEEYGLPIKRSVLANFEGGRRPALSVVELIVLARILAIPPAELLFPVGREDQTEVLPGVPTDTSAAMKWFTGESDRLPTDTEFTQDNAAVRLYGEHDRLLGQWWSARERAMSLMFRDPDLDQFRAEEDPAGYDALLLRQAQEVMERMQEAIRYLRQDMRDRGLLPPMLSWDEGSYIEGPGLNAQAQAVAQAEGISVDEARRKIWSRVHPKTPDEQPQADETDEGEK